MILYNQFLAGSYLNDPTICERIVSYWEDNKQTEGTININGSTTVDHTKKHSLDVKFTPDNTSKVYVDYLDQLRVVAKEYMDLYPWSNNFSPWGVLDTVNIQYYPPGGGFKIWHTERSSSLQPFSSRHLVFMTYLNDVTDGGQTEFYHQEVSVQPKKGLTLIWPADWTFVHRGVPSQTQEKWIITGWFNFF